MAETEPIRVYAPDKEFISDLAEEQGVSRADVVADMVEMHSGERHIYECPHCEDKFELDEIDPETVRERSAVTSDMRHVVRGQRTVKDFECPCCNEPVQPEELDMDTPASPDDVSPEQEG